jgi:hypothetical protein
MIPIGVGVVFLAYTTGIWGFCLVRGYNVKFTQLFGSAWPNAAAGSGSSTSQGFSGQAAAPGKASSGPTPVG